MYILYNKKSLKVEYIYTKPLTVKVCDNFYEINGIAEYKGELPKGDYLVVSNVHEEVETWKEKQTQYKTITELEPQEQWKVVYEEKEDIDEDGNPIIYKVPKRVKQIVNVEVEKEVEEEVEVEKSKTHIVCDLVAHFYPKVELNEQNKEKQYERLCEKYIREKYSLNDELKMSRIKDKNPSLFEEYDTYVEDCLLRASKEVYNDEC